MLIVAMKRPDGALASKGAISLRATRALGAIILLILTGAMTASADPAAYPRMAPLDRYMIADRAKEIAFARSAAPPSVSAHARILVLGRHAYETAVAGDNGFVCLITRSWDKGFGAAEFWNPKIRSPECFNPPAANSVLPRYLERTKWVLAGESMAQMRARYQAEAGKLPAPLPGSFCYMMSKDGYTDDRAAGPWYPHLMFFQRPTAPGEWGGNLSDTPIVADSSSYQDLTYFLVLVPWWSNGAWIAHK